MTRRLCRFVSLSLLGVMLAIPFLAPDRALAAPAISAAPAQVPPGGTVTVAGTGFAPRAALALVGLTARGTMRVKLAEMTAGVDGSFMTTFRVAGFYPAAPLPLVVVSVPDGAEVAQTTVMVTTGPSVATEQLTIAPDAGPVGTRFVATGGGFAAGTTVAFLVTPSAQGPTGDYREVVRITIPADGRVAFTIDSTGYRPEQYDLVAFTDGTIIGFPLVRPTFTVTAPMPGLPSTGGGWAAGGIDLPNRDLSRAR